MLIPSRRHGIKTPPCEGTQHSQFVIMCTQKQNLWHFLQKIHSKSTNQVFNKLLWSKCLLFFSVIWPSGPSPSWPQISQNFNYGQLTVWWESSTGGGGLTTQMGRSYSCGHTVGTGVWRWHAHFPGSRKVNQNAKGYCAPQQRAILSLPCTRHRRSRETEPFTELKSILLIYTHSLATERSIAAPPHVLLLQSC